MTQPNKQGAKLPALRFPEFQDDGEWEEKELKEIAKISSGGTPSRQDSTFWNGKIPWVTTAEIDLNIITNTNEKITLEGLNGSSAKLFPEDTILMARDFIIQFFI